MSTIKVDTLQTVGGNGLFPALAWVNLTGTGVVSINGSANVSSISDIGTGQYTVSFANAMASDDYATTLGHLCTSDGSTSSHLSSDGTSYLASGYKITTVTPGVVVRDSSIVNGVTVQ